MVTIKTENINLYRGINVGRAFYYAFKKFVRDPENEKMIEQRAQEIRESEGFLEDGNDEEHVSEFNAKEAQ